MVMYRLKLPRDQAESLVAELLHRGYLEPSRLEPMDDEPLWATTLEGNAFGGASAARPYKRATAERALAAFLERVEQLNADDRYVYRCTEVVLFGSMLTAAEEVSDVDLAVELTPRYEGDEFVRRCRERVEVAAESDRTFSSFMEELSWPHLEVRLFLKGRSPVLSLATRDDGVLKRAEHRVVYRSGDALD